MAFSIPSSASPPIRRQSAYRGDDANQRAAVIDIGSNTIHLLVADCRPNAIRPIRDLRVRARLGIAVADAGVLGTMRIRAAASVVRTFAAEARAWRAGEIMVLGTHAVRAAADRGALADAVETATGLRVHVLTPEQEATLCLAGASLGPLPAAPFLSVDIGGGSCDVAAVGASGVRGITSVPVGSGVLAARDFDGDPPSAAKVDRASERLAALFEAALPGHAEFPEAVATGGAARRVGRQLTDRQGTAAGEASQLLNVVARLLHSPSTRWPHPVKPARAATARAGGAILRTIIIRWRIPQWRISPYGLREGALALRARGQSLDAASAPPTRARHPHVLEGSSGHHRA